MKTNRRRIGAAWMALITMFVITGYAQSLTDKLAEKDIFYKNYGKDTYSKMTIQQDVIGLYDMFGEHITDGVFMYNLHNSNRLLSSSREGIADSMDYSRSSLYEKNDLFEKFNNLVVTQDAIGGTKSAFMIGDQITTKFTPLTFNKVNFNGIRWDLWSTGLQATFVLSRTRPGFLSKKGGSDSSVVGYPADVSFFPSSYYNMGGQIGDFFARNDYSGKSPFGDYDWLWAIHAQNTIANKVDIGLSYINHHMSDIKKGERWFRGDLPGDTSLGWMPRDVHFEFYDQTPYDKNDAGVYVYEVEMYVNNRPVIARPQFAGIFRQVYIGSPDSILLPSSLPLARPQNGNAPVIVAFKTDPIYWMFTDGRRLSTFQQIKNISFKYTLAGNYLAFVTTSKQIHPAIGGFADPNTGEVTYRPVQKEMQTLYEGSKNVPIKLNQEGESGTDYDWRNYSVTYFGEYICKSPRTLGISNAAFQDICSKDGNGIPQITYNPDNKALYNFATYTYDFDINVSSVTYGVDFSGELGGVKFNGEVALNQREDKMPGSDESRKTQNRAIGTFSANRDLTSRLGLQGDFYYISPDWQTNLDNLQTSRYYKESYFREGNKKDYLAYPRPHGNNWQNIDDNDDNDAFVESDRRHYPSDLSVDAQGNFYSDGTLRWDYAKSLLLPSNMYIAYDDPDGVIASKDDRNRNGIPDYQEDFLLFTSDPPAFELGVDLNNNGLPDYEDDDMLPDFGHSTGFFVTSDGIKTLGIKGVSLDLKYDLSNWNFHAGLIAEGILDQNMNGIDDMFETDQTFGQNFFEGKSIVGYFTAKREVIKRSQGIQYDIGNELRVIRDAIRNDAVQSDGQNTNGAYIVNYHYYIDPLNFRQAVIDNLIGNVIYNNIRNFEYAFRAKVGAQKRIGLDGDFLTEYSFWDPVADNTIFSSRWEPYLDRTIGELFLVNRVSYRIGFRNDFQDWRSFLNAFNRLEIIPQYKISYNLSKEFEGPTTEDPRDLEGDLRRDINHDGIIDSIYDNTGDNLSMVQQARIAALQYRGNNKNLLLNVPILRVNYKIAENTQLQVGLQGLRRIDFITPEEDRFSFTSLAQIVSKANYRGYNVTFFLGAKWQNNDFDINALDPVLPAGNRYDVRGWEFFAQLYSGT
jgi:hypothetical protein